MTASWATYPGVTVSPRLPVDEILAPLVELLRESQAVVVEAPPGAGKTTRIPRALLEAGSAGSKEIWVTEPRRVAARLAASFVARELGTELGGRVGYSVRYEERSSAETRLRFVTEGVLLQRLTAERAPAQIGAVVLDEFHERHVESDLNLMLLRRRLAEDPALRLVVMSATLDGEAISRYLGNCPRLRSEGRVYPIEVRHATVPDDRPLELRASSAIKELLREAPEGDVLVFLPGAREIQATESALAGFAEQQGVALVTLHGELPLEAQARAIARGPRRKVVLSTNVAESSITVEGVTAVVDSGLARVAEHSPWTGRQSLEVRPISRASATQRAGRAGRTAPGKVVRLFTEADLRARPSHERPELQRLDLAEPLLTLFGAGVAPVASDFLDPPSEVMLDAGKQLLQRLGLLDAEQRLTALGRRAARLPLHPRLGRMLLEGERLGIARSAAIAAAVLGERDVRLGSGEARYEGEVLGCECDIDQLIQLFRLAERERFAAGALRRLGLHAGRMANVRQGAQQLWRALGGRGGARDDDPDELSQRALSLALLAGFPDRVARRRQPGSRELIVCTGHTAQLAEESVVRSASLLLAVDAEERSSAVRAGQRTVRAGIRVRLAAPLEPEWLLDHAADELTEKDELSWDEGRERVMLTSQLCWGAVVLDQSERPAPPGPEAGALLERAALAQLATLFGKGDSLGELLARVELLAAHRPSTKEKEPDAEARVVGMRELLHAACQTATSLAELRALDWRETFLAQLDARDRAALERDTPEWVQLGGGRRVRVHYVAGQPPWIASRLQDFFGMREGPRILGGRVALTLHLLAPSQRPVQVTSDLAGFWERHYPSIRRELMRKYPKHAWPEDGRVTPQK